MERMEQMERMEGGRRVGSNAAYSEAAGALRDGGRNRFVGEKHAEAAK